MHRARLTSVLMIAVVTGMLACSEDPATCAEEQPLGPATGATCPAGSTLTYENFGKPFMEKYCTSCHSSTLRGEEARQCAPEGHDVDTLMGILPIASHIDKNSASGPNATNTQMPPSGAKPTLTERQQLGEWLACESGGGATDGGGDGG